MAKKSTRATRICDKADGVIRESLAQRDRDIRWLLSHCESPVEQILLAAMHDRFNACVQRERKGLVWTLETYPPDATGIFEARLSLQRVIEAMSGDEYRADFYIYLTRWVNDIDVLWYEPPGESKHYPEYVRLVVEVDGHNFHDRTKEQAARDRRRDRELLLEDCPTIRFTGSDVGNDPYGCVEDMDNQLINLAWTAYLKYLGGRLDALITGRRRAS